MSIYKAGSPSHPLLLPVLHYVIGTHTVCVHTGKFEANHASAGNTGQTAFCLHMIRFWFIASKHIKAAEAKTHSRLIGGTSSWHNSASRAVYLVVQRRDRASAGSDNKVSPLTAAGFGVFLSLCM